MTGDAGQQSVNASDYDAVVSATLIKQEVVAAKKLNISETLSLVPTIRREKERIADRSDAMLIGCGNRAREKKTMFSSSLKTPRWPRRRKRWENSYARAKPKMPAPLHAGE